MGQLSTVRSEKTGQPAAADPLGPVNGHTFTVAIVDDQPVRRAGIEWLLAPDPTLSIVASVSRVDDLSTVHARPDLVVLDLPAGTRDEAVALIARVAAQSRPIVISAWDTAPSLLSAVRAGACACVSRQADRSAVGTAIRAVADGGFYVCHRLRQQFHHELTNQPLDDSTGLAPREVETLRWIAQGFTQAQIARRMGLSQATINTYAKRIRTKLGATNKAELTRLAIQLGHLTSDRHASTAA
ncbi:response regulator transcription factor [Dactylosporangium salmoneum]|uniref:Response regulator transcription factor n=1 Tax=Dactylosporangium salmoneum TaxID=53361 RepID=A0ABN3H9V5_9ACTN